MSFPFDLHNSAVSDSHLPCHAPIMPFFSRPQHGRRETAVLCCGLERTAWYGHGMASVNQTRPHCVNQTGKTHSKPLAAWHGRVTAWVRHAMCESAFRGQKNTLTQPGIKQVTVHPVASSLCTAPAPYSVYY